MIRLMIVLLCFTSQLTFAAQRSHIITTKDMLLVDFNCGIDDEVSDPGTCVVRFQQNGYGVVMDFTANYKLVYPFVGIEKNSPALRDLTVVFSDETNEIFSISH